MIKICRKGFSLVELMIVIVIISILAAIAIPNQLRARLNASQEQARATLKVIASACETYATTHNGNFPANVTDLTAAPEPYLNFNYCDGAAHENYTFDCSGMTTAGYTITANSTIAGAIVYTITTGMQLTPPG